jgi:hypothetical protein
LSSRPLRTSWLIVGMGGLDLLPALGRALDVVLCWGRAAVPGPARSLSRARPPHIVRPPRSGVSPFPEPVRWLGPNSVAPRDSAPPPPGRHVLPWPGSGPRRPKRSPRRTANGSRPRAPWARLTTIPVPWRPVKAGSLTGTDTRARCPPPGRTTPGMNDAPAGSLPGGAARPGEHPVARPTVPGGRAEREQTRATGGCVVPPRGAARRLSAAAPRAEAVPTGPGGDRGAPWPRGRRRATRSALAARTPRVTRSEW